MTAAGNALAVPGNHEHKLVRALEGRVLYGHTPMRSAISVNNTRCLDTGCVFGGS